MQFQSEVLYCNAGEFEILFQYQGLTKFHGSRLPEATIVFYHGTDEYDGCRTLHDMLSFDKENEIFRQYVPDYHINLVTLEDLEEENFQTGLRELTGFLKRSKNKMELQKYCLEHADRMQEMDEDTFDTISVMIGKTDFVTKKGAYMEGDKIDMCKAMRDWEEDLLKEGMEQGIERGIEALILDNLDEGVPEARIIEKLQNLFLLDREAAQNCLVKYSTCI